LLAQKEDVFLVDGVFEAVLSLAKHNQVVDALLAVRQLHKLFVQPVEKFELGQVLRADVVLVRSW
jgi:hypothetical protein